MKVSLAWLEEFIDLPTRDPAELKHTLDMLGHEVEGYERLEPGWSGVVVGVVTEIAPHPDADKVRVCQVDTGRGPEQIICGAWNFTEGARVAVALPGAVLPGDFTIGRREIRGVVSNGMICSERELGLGADHAGILVLDGDPVPGTDFTELVELPDVVFDISITPNRPDAMSYLGIARDLAAHYDIEYRTPELELVTVPEETDITVEVEDPVGCRRFTATEIRGVTVGPAPLRVRHRLHKVGARSISNIVDVTNYVMFELGHPLHAFDADTIAGARLTVRRADPGDRLTTLDDVERGLRETDLIIYDAEGPTSMSGTMGGARSEVSAATTNVLMEAASWDPPTIMYMSRGHGLISEASIRFERGVDPALAETANRRAAALVRLLAGGEVLEGGVDVGGGVEPAVIDLTLDDVTRLLGDGFDPQYVSGILTRLGMEVDGEAPMRVKVPTFRPDLTRPADLVEEVARIHGYEKFGATVPTGVAGRLTPEQRRMRLLRHTLVGVGLHEVVSLPFVGEDEVALIADIRPEQTLRVKNPLRDEEARLRPSMLPGLLNVARYNVARGERAVSVFETGLVFSAQPHHDDPRLPLQVHRLGWVLTGPVGPRALDREATEAGAPYSLSLLRHLLRMLGISRYSLSQTTAPGHHPGRTAAVEVDGTLVGVVGELSPATAKAFDLPDRVGVAELDLEPLLTPVVIGEAKATSPFPPHDFDLSFVVGAGLAASALVEATVEAGGDLVESAEIFDQFEGAGLGQGERAVAITYRLRAPDRTLTNEEVAPVRAAMISAGEALGARLRGAG